MREFIVEADGGSRGNPGPAGYGSVVIDAATGETLAERAEYIGVATNNVAEYRGLVAGLRAARELDPSATVRVRMDSKLVVEQMSGRWKIKHPDMKPLAAEAARVLPAAQVTYEWIPRERNKHADRLANEAMDAGKRGEQWEASASRAGLDARVRETPAVPEPAGPPGDAAAGAAKAREALTRSHLAPAAAQAPSGTEDAPATRVAGAADGQAAGSGGDEDTTKTRADRRAARGVAAQAAVTEAGPAPDAGRAAEGGPGVTPSVGWGAAPDLGAPATFVLLRHGETPLTPQKRFSGSGGTDPSLSDVGREQAERVAAAFARRGTIQHILASPLARTRETAGAVAARLGLEVTVEDGLIETDFGAWEGLTFGEVRERHPEDLNAWLADPEAEPTGGGESFAATATRIAATRDRLVARYAGRTVLLVTHVTPIKTFVRLALGAPPESLFRMELSAASVSAVAYYADGNASVRLLNDTSHLRP
ncbi:bifunctional RNase H/acid phosphatase [Streptomyces sp. MBT97]|uniref:bifunctional RNase H/acid phosphatase n=1 Tax=Streptomyces sp. MBT97 TaxID=2800411 RepID=UPI00190D0F49|nr:bifunctional RNase H/acid phosphatase [Streptomyces sp. MBT97]MBK3631940.1 bifunctional RNase H/acid phosphatase [Streptomyces sp. MBT97]